MKATSRLKQLADAVLKKVGWNNFAFTMKPPSKREQRLTAQRYRSRAFDLSRPHHGDDLVEALEYEWGLRSHYPKGEEALAKYREEQNKRKGKTNRKTKLTNKKARA